MPLLWHDAPSCAPQVREWEECLAVLGNWEGADADAMDVQVANTQDLLPDSVFSAWTGPGQP